MTPERAGEIDWSACSRLDRRDGTSIAVARGSALLHRRTVHYLDAASAEWTSIPISAVRRVSAHRGMGYFALFREIEFTRDDYLMLSGVEVEEFGGMTERQKRELLLSHPTIVTEARRMDARRAARMAAVAERLERGNVHGRHARCDHPRTTTARKKCHRLEMAG